MSADSGQLDRNIYVLRVLRTAVYLPDGALLPNWDAFAPSNDDKQSAETSGKPVRVSVWDMRETTVAQAFAMRKTSDELRGFKLKVQDVIDVGTSSNNDRMRVVPDPEGAPDPTLPGAKGHAGIEGLDRPKGVQKTEWKKMLDLLAQRCVSVPSE